MKTSCIAHPQNEPLIMIRQWQLEFCEGNHCAAALLSFLEYWHNIKLEHAAQAKQKNRVAEQHGDTPTQDESLFQFHTAEAISKGLLGLYGETKIREARGVLRGKGVLSEHKNPNERYAFDKTTYFLFQPEACQAFLQARSGSSTASNGKNEDRDGKNTESEESTTYVSSRSGSSTASNGKNTGTITEITTELFNTDTSVVLEGGTGETKPEPAQAAPEPATSSKNSQGTRLPKDWIIPEEWKEWGRTERPDLDIDKIADGFKDHWIAEPGRKGKKLDWQATWRNWVRNQWYRNSGPLNGSGRKHTPRTPAPDNFSAKDYQKDATDIRDLYWIDPEHRTEH